MSLLDDFTRGLSLIGGAVTGDAAPLQAAATNTVNNFNRGVTELRNNAPTNIANIAGNFADDFTRGLGVVRDNPSVLPGAVLRTAGEMAAQPVASAQHLGEAIGNAASGRGTWDDALGAVPEFAGGALLATQLARGGTGLLNSALRKEGASPSMLSLRRQFTHIPVEAGDGLMETGNMTGGFLPSETPVARLRQLGYAANNFENSMMRTSNRLQGAYYPNERAAFSPAYDMELRRHEVAHGIMDRAIRAGNASGLPLPLRIPAQLEMSSNPTLQGLGYLTNEMAARGAEGGLNRALSFLDRPLNFYADQIAEKSPLVSAIYRYQAIPRGVTGAATAAGAAGGYMAGNQLFGQ